QKIPKIRWIYPLEVPAKQGRVTQKKSQAKGKVGKRGIVKQVEKRLKVSKNLKIHFYERLLFTVN
ncbi:MAG: hypothetical protein KC736_02285, partial [Candidatus Moranbacteria bacterium]|nr:hypothetical protein [Candidatus Moranbacteria bacterium]